MELSVVLTPRSPVSTALGCLCAMGLGVGPLVGGDGLPHSAPHMDHAVTRLGVSLALFGGLRGAEPMDQGPRGIF